MSTLLYLVDSLTKDVVATVIGNFDGTEKLEKEFSTSRNYNRMFQ